MKIKYFAWIRELTKNDEELLDFDKEILRFAVNQEYVVENIHLNEDDEIAVFPPVSGG